MTIEVIAALVAAFTLWGVGMFVMGLHVGLRIFGLSIAKLLASSEKKLKAGGGYGAPGDLKYDDDGYPVFRNLLKEYLNEAQGAK